MPVWIRSVAESWGSFYGNHTVVSVTVLFFHLAGLLVGGGSALAADRAVIAAVRDRSQRTACLASLARVHWTVVPALAIMAATGALMALADLDAFVASGVFYLKLIFVAALVVNGLLLVWAERAARDVGGDAVWTQLRAAAVASSALWIGTVLVGVWLTKAA
jgi:hypothetical protein